MGVARGKRQRGCEEAGFAEVVAVQGSRLFSKSGERLSPLLLEAWLVISPEMYVSQPWEGDCWQLEWRRWAALWGGYHRRAHDTDVDVEKASERSPGRVWVAWQKCPADDGRAQIQPNEGIGRKGAGRTAWICLKEA